MPHAPLLRAVMNAAADRYTGMIIRLEPTPNRLDQDCYTLAVKGSKLLKTFSPDTLDWKTVGEGTLQELLRLVEAVHA